MSPVKFPWQAKAPKSAAPKSEAPADAKNPAATKRFTVKYREAQVGEERHFVPDYAAGRPASLRILDGKHFEPATHALVARLLADRPGDLVHAGTFFGDMLPSFSRACPGRVYAFEPVLENYVLAKQSVEANALDNVLLTNAGLGEAIAPAFIDVGKPNRHRGGGSAIAGEGQRTMLTTVDSFGLGKLSVLQLDVEGHELAALKGARRTILACRPTILVEDGSEPTKDYLKELGYRRAGRIPGVSVWGPADQKKTLLPIVRALREEAREDSEASSEA